MQEAKEKQSLHVPVLLYRLDMRVPMSMGSWKVGWHTATRYFHSKGKPA